MGGNTSDGKTQTESANGKDKRGNTDGNTHTGNADGTNTGGEFKKQIKPTGHTNGKHIWKIQMERHTANKKGKMHTTDRDGKDERVIQTGKYIPDLRSIGRRLSSDLYGL